MVWPSRRLIARVSVWWSKAILAVGGARLTIKGREHLTDDEVRIYLVNHQSALDIAILLVGLEGDVRFLSKDALFRIPLFGWILRRYGHIRVERCSARATLRSIEDGLTALGDAGISVAVFAEGTRSADGGLLPFRRGTMKICQRAGLAVVPVCIDGSGKVNPKIEDVAYPGPVRLTFGRPIPKEEVAIMTPEQLHDRVRSAIAGMFASSQPDAAAA